MDESDNEPLFMVRRKDGYPVFAVYEHGVEAYTDTSGSVAGIKGGFAVGGYVQSKKGLGEEYMRVTPDSIRFYVDRDNSKGIKGGFAVGGYTTPYKKGASDELLRVTPDSVRIYIDDDPGNKGIKGGFAVGGYSTPYKGSGEYFNISARQEAEMIPGENRLVWYPQRNAFLTGNVLIESPDSVGENSMATGYQSKAIGDYSEAFGYQSAARGIYSTAIGKNATANSANSFALGESAVARNDYAYAFGRNTIASGYNSFALGSGCVSTAHTSISMGLASRATHTGSLAIGFNSDASEVNAIALGSGNASIGNSSVAMGFSNKAIGDYSLAFGKDCFTYDYNNGIAIGLNDTANGTGAIAIGIENLSQGTASVAIGYGSRTNTSHSLAAGYRNHATGIGSVAIGKQAVASGVINGSISIGLETMATGGSGAVAMGYSSDAEGEGSIAIGIGNKATGDYAGTVGYATEAQAYRSFVVGSYNTISGNKTGWVGTDPIFVVGNGPDSYSRSNALTLLKNGNMDLNGNLTINGYLTGSSGTMLQSTDEWLRLNPGNAHSNGTYISGLLRADGGLYVGDDEYFYRYSEDVIRTYDNLIVSAAMGIGTTSPATPLHVVTSSATIGTVRGESNYGGTAVHYGGAFGATTGTNGIGCYAAGSSRDFFAGGPGTNYYPFTGSHEVILSADIPGDIEPGMLVSLTGYVEKRYMDNGDVSLSSTMPEIRLTNRANDKAVLGVFISEDPHTPDHWLKKDVRVGTVNALGEGRAWVCESNGNIEAGDYITSSAIAGFGQRQDDDLLHNYTLGKATETVNWENVETIRIINGKAVKVYLIGIIYTSG